MLRQLAITMFLLSLLALIWVVWGVPEMERRRAERARATLPEAPRERRTAPPATAIPRLSGVVTAAGEPVAEAVLVLHWLQALGAESRPVRGEALGETESGEGGIYAFDLDGEFLPCAARLEVRADGFAVRATGPFRLDGSGGRLDVALEPELAIEGIVVTEAGEGPRGVVRIHAIPDDEVAAVLAGSLDDASVAYFGHTEEDGRFRIGGLQPGRYRLFVGSPEWTERDVVDVRAGATAVKLVVAGSRWLTVSARNIEDDAPIPSFSIHCDIPGVITGVFEGDAGGCRLRVPRDPWLNGVIRIEAPGYAGGRTWASVSPDHPDVRFSMYPDRGVNLIVSARYEDGAPVQSQLVAAIQWEFGRLPLYCEHQGEGIHGARAPLLSGRIRIYEADVLMAKGVEQDFPGPGRVRVELSRPGAIRIRRPSLPEVERWSPSLWYEGEFLSGETELESAIRARAGSWRVQLFPLPMPDDWWSARQLDVTFDLAPGGRVVVELADGRLVAR